MSPIPKMAETKPKNCLLILLLLIWTFLVASCKKTAPNIVIIVSDDLGSRDIGFVDSDISTPYLNQLAAQGVKLTNHYVQPTCAPSRNELMTGRYEINMGVQLGFLGPCEVGGMSLQYKTMADYLKAAGYSTHIVGKWHLGFYREEYTPLYRGFDTFYGILVGYANHFNYVHCFSLGGGFCGYALLDGEVPDYSAIGTYSAQTFTDKAIEVIKNSSKSDEPMFLYLSYTVPHEPIESPEIYYEKYNNMENEERKVYAGMVSALDEGVKNVTQTLIEEGMWENTVLIFLSDNGANVSTGSTNWPLRGKKNGWWEGGIKNNAFVASPLLKDSAKGKERNELMHITDWLPTVAEVAGIQLDDSLGLDGVSQWSMIQNGGPGPRTEILHNIDEKKDFYGPRMSSAGTFDTSVSAAIRVGDYKLLCGNPGDGGWYPIPGETFEDVSYTDFGDKSLWLFNVAEDPNELEDLSETMPEKVRELLDRLVYYDAQAVPSAVLSSDYDNCDPLLRGGYWAPWIY